MDGIRTSLKCKNMRYLEEVGTRSPVVGMRGEIPAGAPGIPSLIVPQSQIGRKKRCPFFQAAARPKPLALPPQALARLGSAHR